MSGTLEFRLDQADILKAIQELPGFDDITRYELTQATQENIVWAFGFLAKYPPPPIGSKYTRTGTLGKNWGMEIRQFSGSVRGMVANPIDYGPYVQDEAFQARIHRGRWPTVQMLLRAPVKLFEKRYVVALRRILNKMTNKMPRGRTW